MRPAGSIASEGRAGPSLRAASYGSNESQRAGCRDTERRQRFDLLRVWKCHDGRGRLRAACEVGLQACARREGAALPTSQAASHLGRVVLSCCFIFSMAWHTHTRAVRQPACLHAGSHERTHVTYHGRNTAPPHLFGIVFFSLFMRNNLQHGDQQNSSVDKSHGNFRKGSSGLGLSRKVTNVPDCLA